MVLYTPLSNEEIFPEQEENMELVKYKGRSIYVRSVEDEWQIVQLMSSNPNDFLDSEFSPGNFLSGTSIHKPK